MFSKTRLVGNLGTSALYPARLENEVEFELLKHGWVRAQTVDSRTSSPIFYDVFEMLNVPWSLMQRKCVWLWGPISLWGHIHTSPNGDGFASNMRLEWRSDWPQMHPCSEYRGLIALIWLEFLHIHGLARDQSSTAEFTWSATTKVCIQTEAPPPPEGLTSKITVWEQWKIKERQRWVKGVGKRFVVVLGMQNGPLMVLWAIWPINMLYFDELFFDADIIPSPAKHPIDLHQRVFPGRNASFNGPYKCSCTYSSWQIQTWCFSDIEMGSLKLNNADICVTAL